MAIELLALLSGLAAAFSWGAGDFAGGLASRRAAAVRVVVASQAIGLAALLALAPALRQPAPQTSDLLWGALAGLAGGIGLLLLYMSLARGKMGVAAPLTAVASGGLPLAAGLATEGLPGVAQIAGFGLALAAIWVISRPDGAGEFRLGDVGLPLLAGVGFGTFLALIGRVSADAGFVWPLVAARVASLTMLSTVLVWGAARSRGGASAPATPFPWIQAAVAGLGDTAGNMFFAFSAQNGRLDVAAVLGALYPAVTVLLARLVLDERLSPRQGVGVALALGAVVLIAL